MKSYSVTIQMKATEQYFPVVLFIMFNNAVLTLSLWKISYSVTSQMKALEQHFTVVVFIMINKVVLFLSLDQSFCLSSIFSLWINPRNRAACFCGSDRFFFFLIL